MSLFDIDHIFFTVFNYPVSYLEFFGLVTGLIAVGLSAMANVWSWPIGIVNVTLSFFLFFQVQLYPDMFLQIFFFITNVIGWWRWTHPKPFEEDNKHELKVSFMNNRGRIIILLVTVIGTFVFGILASNLHQLLPMVFSKPSASPFLDSFITVMSVVTTFYMIDKKIECWIIWLVVDIVATYLYFTRNIVFYGVLYLAFCFIAAFALWNWIREYKSYSTT